MKSPQFILAAFLALSFCLTSQAGEQSTQKTAAQKSAPASAQKTTAAQKTTNEATQKATTWQAIAEQRAATMAARRFRGHLAGVPSGCFEGVGWGGWGCATCVGSGSLLADAQCQAADGTVYRVRLWSGGGSVRQRTTRTRWIPRVRVVRRRR